MINADTAKLNETRNASYACNGTVRGSWPVRFTERPLWHLVSRVNHLNTACGKVISGPSWVRIDNTLDAPVGSGIIPPADSLICMECAL